MAGDELRLKFNSPLGDSRVPDIIVQPQYGTIYTSSTKKNAEHGGFSFGDTNVGLIVSNPSLRTAGCENTGSDFASGNDDPAEPRHRSAGPEGGAPRAHSRTAGPAAIEPLVRNPRKRAVSGRPFIFHSSAITDLRLSPCARKYYPPHWTCRISARVRFPRRLFRSDEKHNFGVNPCETFCPQPR